jgi:drug/metabolite transporter (DMT)-like permease
MKIDILRKKDMQHQKDLNKNLNLQKGVLLALTGIVLFSTMNALIKGVQLDYPPVQVAFIRFFISLLVCGGLYLGEKNRPSLFPSWELTFKHCARGIISVLGITSLCASLRLLPLGDATALNFSSILFITALSVPLLGQKVDFSRWISILIGFLGILVVAQPKGEVFSLGAIYALTYSIADAYVIILGRILSEKHSPGASAFVFCLFASIVSGVMSFFYWQTPTLYDALLLLLVGICGGGGFLFQTLSYNLTSASVIGPMAYSGVIWSLLFGFFFWSEIPNFALIFGYFLIVGSGCYIIYKEYQTKVS